LPPLTLHPPPPWLRVAQVGDLSSGRLRFKVDVNAQENHMTGAAVLGTDFAVVVVEGGPKTLRR
jgi:U4/U6 small nuclear ribonucleoprotein PRP3